MEEKEIIIPEENYIELEEEIFAPEEDADEEEIPEEGEAEPEVVEEEQVKTVPLAALQQERAEKKAYKEKLRQYEGVFERLYNSTGATNPEELAGRMDNIELAQMMQREGVREDMARRMLNMQRENSELKKQGDRRRFDDEITELSGNPMYDDILDVRDEVEEYAQKKGLTPKEAYNALYGEARAEKMKNASAKQKIKENKKIHGLSQRGNAAEASGTYGLTPNELAAAKMGGMTPKEYAAYKKKE
jgi:hypothetical protein